MADPHKRLFCIEKRPKIKGQAFGSPVVFLHGFGGRAQNWEQIQARVCKHHATLAFDLPGHGGSLDYPDFGEPKVAARAVIDELAACSIDRAHIVGFSMGGAAAALVGLFAPEKVASLTLLAPGGFGPEINHRVLLAFAAAESEADFRRIMPQFFGFNAEISDEFYRQEALARKASGATDALVKIAALLFDGKPQGVIPLAPLVDAGFPIKILWGTQDNILPTRQAHKLPGLIATHVFKDTGHMLIEEQGEAVVRLVLENCG